MEADGFVLGGFEGPATQAGFRNALPVPFALHGARPDAWGLHRKHPLIGFAEAKTMRDVNTKHTRRQLRVFGTTKMKSSGDKCPLYVAVPQSAAYALDKVLVDVGLLQAANLIRLHIPDALLKAG
jgi:hypothetical protein